MQSSIVNHIRLSSINVVSATSLLVIRHHLMCLIWFHSLLSYRLISSISFALLIFWKTPFFLIIYPLHCPVHFSFHSRGKSCEELCMRHLNLLICRVEVWRYLKFLLLLINRVALTSQLECTLVIWHLTVCLSIQFRVSLLMSIYSLMIQSWLSLSL